MSLIELLSLIVTVAGFGFIAYEIHKSGKQAQGSTFLELTSRYERLVERHGVEIARRFSVLPRDTFHDQKLSAFLVDYVDLLHQEFELFRVGMIDKEIWRIWATYFAGVARSEHFRSWWTQEKDAYGPNPAFVQFVERTMRDE